MSRNLLKLFLASRVKRSLLPESSQLTWMHARSVTKSFLTLCDPMDCSPPCSSVHRIFQARILDCVAISSPKGSSLPREWTSPMAPALAGEFFTIELPGKPFSSTDTRCLCLRPRVNQTKVFTLLWINVKKCFVEMSCYNTEFCSSLSVYPHSQFFSRRLVETSRKVIIE